MEKLRFKTHSFEVTGFSGLFIDVPTMGFYCALNGGYDRRLYLKTGKHSAVNVSNGLSFSNIDPSFNVDFVKNVQVETEVLCEVTK